MERGREKFFITADLDLFKRSRCAAGSRLAQLIGVTHLPSAMAHHYVDGFGDTPLPRRKPFSRRSSDLYVSDGNNIPAVDPDGES